MTDTVTQRIACKAVIARGGKVLLLREASTYEEGTNIGRYHMPGGRIDVGEPFLEGLQREVREETGLAITAGKPLYVGEWFPVIKGIKNQIVAIFFVCEPQDGDVVLSEEHDDYQWVDAGAWKSLDVMAPEDTVLETYFASQG
jgi:8-oxo-dGTP diphosphatase